MNHDSPDHRSHMAYPDGAKCPADHPVKVVRLSLHIHYRGLTNAQGYQFAANPDGTRPGPHADFFNGWDQTALEHLVDICANAGTGHRTRQISVPHRSEGMSVLHARWHKSNPGPAENASGLTMRCVGKTSSPGSERSTRTARR